MSMTKQFINRIKELKWLEDAYQKASKEGQFLVLYGKRRVGKTELVTHFLKNKPYIYYLANRTTKGEQLQSATSVFMSGLGDTYIAGSSFPNWREFFDYLIKKIGERPETEQPITLVFDEFPYLAEADSGVSSFFQYGWDMGLKDKRILFIVMGSSISMMYKHVLIKSAPLYGRRSAQWLLEPFNYQETKNFYQGAPFENSFPLFAISGGIPAYAREFNGQKTLRENIEENVLPEGKFLSVEPEFLLSEEFDDPRSYLTILQAIGLGRTKFSQILQQSHLPATSLPIYLQTLTELRLVKKEVPVTEPIPEKSKKGSYSLSDPFLRFYFSFIFPNNSLIKSHSYDALFTQHGEILTRLVAKSYEDTTGEFIQEAINQKLLPHFEQTGRWWDKNTEIDLVGLNKGDDSILFVETKWNTKPLDIDVLVDLKKSSKAIKWGSEKRKEYFALVAKGGFSEELIKKAEKENVLLILEDRIFLPGKAQNKHHPISDIPEIHLQLYGVGSKRTIEGHVEKRDDKTLILETVELNGYKTQFEQQFTKLIFLNNLKFPDSIFTTKEPEIKARVVYRTLDGKRYELLQTMTQEKRADGVFNVALTGNPSIKRLNGD